MVLRKLTIPWKLGPCPVPSPVGCSKKHEENTSAAECRFPCISSQYVGDIFFLCVSAWLKNCEQSISLGQSDKCYHKMEEVFDV